MLAHSGAALLTDGRRSAERAGTEGKRRERRSTVTNPYNNLQMQSDPMRYLVVQRP